MTNQQAPSRCKHPSCFYSNKQQPHTKAGCACVISCCHEAPSESWEKEFDEKFKDVWCSKISSFVPIPGGVRLAMHDFIRKVRAEAVLEALERVVADNPECLRESCDLDEVLERIEAIKKELTDPK